MVLARPEAGEVSAPLQAGYIARVPGEVDPAPALETQRERLLEQLRLVTEASASHRYAPDKWSIKQVVGHLADAERIFAYRLLRIARGDQTPLPGFEENAYVEAAAFDDASFESLITEWTSVRAASITLVRGITEAAWSRLGTSNGAPISARALLYLILGHTDHHRGVLEDRYGVGRNR